MKLTKEILARYIDGQMETQNPRDGYLYRGEIAQIGIEAGELKVGFAWLAKGNDYPPLPGKWVKADQLDYSVSIGICKASDIGQGRLAINVPTKGEISVLYPPGGSRLDPSQIEGL